jgi:hypothetical protein
MATPNLTPVSSSNISAVGYDPVESTLYISFVRNGALYAYYEVPIEVYTGLLTASSKGSYFHSVIRDAFEYEQVL